MIEYFKQFGGRISDSDIAEYKRANNWNGKVFENISKTTIDVNITTLPGLLKNQLSDRASRVPNSSIPIHKGYEQFEIEASSKTQFVWFGHSVLLMSIGGKTILIDPMFGDDTSPIAPIKSKRFSDHTKDIIDQLPPIDAILITHDHYDHLDYGSIHKLKTLVDTWYVALGVGRHLRSWGVAASCITEFVWWEQLQMDDVKITFVPSRHFTGRGLTDRTKCLWGGWILQSSQDTIYWSGDGGYDSHFKEIGERFGPFDWTFIECGQYNKLWRQIHLHPEEAVIAALDAQTKCAIPVHWGGFSLAMHPWREPIQRFKASAINMDLPICTPQIGELIKLNQEIQNKEWWELY